MVKTELKNTNTETIQDLGILVAGMGDIANDGLVYLLRGEDKTPLMPPVFCKDYFQDFAYCNVIKDSTKGVIYGYTAQLYPKFDLVEKLNLLLFPFNKNGNSEKDFFTNKTLLFKELLLNEEVVKSFKEQLKIFEERLIELKFINLETNVELIKVNYETKKSVKLLNENCISLDVDKTYFYTPELLSLYLLFIRNFFTSFIFVKEFSSLNDYLKNIGKYSLKFLYTGDQSILNNTNFQLKLPIYLDNKMKKQTWEDYKNQNISSIHNNSGIFSYLNKQANG